MQPPASRRVRRLLLLVGMIAVVGGAALAGEATWRAGQVEEAAADKARQAHEEGVRWAHSLEQVSATRQLAHFDERRVLLQSFTQARRQRALGFLVAFLGVLTAAGAWVAGRIEHQMAEIDSASS